MNVVAEAPPTAWGVTVSKPAVDALAADLAGIEFRLPDFDYPGVPSVDMETWPVFVVLGTSVVWRLWATGSRPFTVEWEGAALDDASAVWACFSRWMAEMGSLRLPDFAGFDAATAARFFRGDGELQAVERRGEILADVAQRLQSLPPLAEVATAAENATALSTWLTNHLPPFHDRPVTTAGVLPFDKLSNLAVSMIASRIPVAGRASLPVFPDYMLPRYLRHHGVLVYEPELANLVDTRQLVPEGSAQEHGIRWATMYAGNQLLRELGRRGVQVDSPTLDYHMWFEAVLGPEAPSMGEHHRTMTERY